MGVEKTPPYRHARQEDLPRHPRDGGNRARAKNLAMLAVISSELWRQLAPACISFFRPILLLSFVVLTAGIGLLDKQHCANIMMVLMRKSTLLLSVVLSTASAFAPRSSSFGVSSSSSSSSTQSQTALYISSWGTKGPPAFRQQERGNPEDRIQDYLPEPGPVEARANIDATCLVSGCCHAKDRTDQFLFDLLNHQDSAFEFEKIVAFVDDIKFAKKRLLSRSARYTGLLDKLDFMQAEDTSGGGLPTAEQLKDVKSWLAVLETDNIEKCKEIAAIAGSVDSLENVAILLQNANELEAAACQTVVDALKSSGKQYTVVAVGKIEDRPEGQFAYHYGEFGADDAVLPAKAVFSREESYRMITELLQLEAGVNKALTFAEVYNVNVTEARLIKGLREAGYARPQEIDHMVREGPKVRTEICLGVLKSQQMILTCRAHLISHIIGLFIFLYL